MAWIITAILLGVVLILVYLLVQAKDALEEIDREFGFEKRRHLRKKIRRQ